MRVEIRDVTPTFAKGLLDGNTANRKVNKAQLDMLCRTIRDGHWRLTHQGVAVYESGELADGQHRLMAIVETGITCQMPVFYGIEKEDASIMAIDCGRSRTVGDSSSLTGHKVAPKDSAIITGLEFGFKGARPKLTHLEMLELAKKHQQALTLINSITKRSFKGVSIAPVKVAMAEALAEKAVTIDFAAKFYKSLVTGEYTDRIMINAIRMRNKLLAKNYNASWGREAAYQFTKRVLKNSFNGIEVKRIA